MNYNALTLEEVARLASTDENARQYLADNAEQILLEAEDKRDEYIDGVVQDAYRTGQDDGSNEERQDLRDTYGERILKLHARLDALGDLDKFPLAADCKELLENLIDEYAMNR